MLVCARAMFSLIIPIIETRYFCVLYQVLHELVFSDMAGEKSHCIGVTTVLTKPF